VLTRAGALSLGRTTTNGLLLADTLGLVLGAYRYTSRGELQGFQIKHNNTTLFATGYEQDSLGRIRQLFDTTQGTPTRWSFVYDSLGRLAADSTNGAIFHVFTYDANGNRATFASGNGTVNYTYDAQDRLLTAGTTSYVYGSNGELRTKTVPGVGTTTNTYDALGNLMTVVLPSGTRIDYVIDGQNRRVGRKVNGALVQALLYQNQLNPVAELDGSGNLVSRFVYVTRANVPDYMVRNGVTYRLVGDHLGSVRLVVDVATGGVAQRMDYDEWGNVIQNTNPGFQPFGFVGGLYDAQTGLTRFGARDYDPAIGRWTSRDALLFGGRNANLYAYGRDPINFIDPSGLAPCAKDPWAACKQALWRLGINAGANLLGAEILGALGKLGRIATFDRVAMRADATASLLADFNEISAAARRSQFAQRVEGVGTRFAAEGVPQLGVGVGVKIHEVADAVDSDRPWWWKILSVLPVIGVGIDLGEAIDACTSAIGADLVGP